MFLELDSPQLISLSRRITRAFFRLLACFHIGYPFRQSSLTGYTAMASQPAFGKLMQEDLESFRNDVCHYLADARLPGTEYTIFEALLSFVKSKQIAIVPDPTDEVGMNYIHRHWMVEVLVRKEGVFFALYEALNGELERLEGRYHVYNWRDGTNRRLRFIQRPNGGWSQSTISDRPMFFDPTSPVVVFSPKLPSGHPLTRWIPMN